MGKRIFKNLMCIYLIFLILFVVLKFDGSFDELISIHQRIIENETMGIKNINLVLFRTFQDIYANNCLSAIMISESAYTMINIFFGKLGMEEKRSDQLL